MTANFLNRRNIGLLLVLAAILVAALIQWRGPGLIVVEHPPPPPPTITAQGFKVVTGIEKTTVHFSVIPLVVVTVIGLFLMLVPASSEDTDRP